MAETDHPLGPGEGGTTNISVSLHAGTIGAVRARAGRRGVSAYIEAAVQRQIERDNLQELVDDHVSRHGGFTPEELAAAEAELFGADRPTGGSGHAA